MSLASDELHAEMFSTGRPETGPDALPEARRREPSPAVLDSPSTVSRPTPTPLKTGPRGFASHVALKVRLASVPPSDTSGPSSHPWPSLTTPDEENDPRTKEKKASVLENPGASQFTVSREIAILQPATSCVAQRGNFNCRCGGKIIVALQRANRMPRNRLLKDQARAKNVAEGRPDAE